MQNFRNCVFAHRKVNGAHVSQTTFWWVAQAFVCPDLQLAPVLQAVH